MTILNSETKVTCSICGLIEGEDVWAHQLRTIIVGKKNPHPGVEFKVVYKTPGYGVETHTVGAML